MSREPKFMAWDTINKRMYPVAYPTWNGLVEGKIDFVNHTVEVIDEDGDDKPVLMQFTGLLDRTGKEVYEGYIVKWYVNDVTRIGVVEYIPDRGCYDLKNLNDEYHVCNDWFRGTYEVIGNIYENPELLRSEL